MKAARRLFEWGASLTGALIAMPVWANPQRWQLDMTTGVTETARDVHQLHFLILLICVAIGVLVFGAMIVAMIKFRRSKGAVAATWSHNTLAEIIWTVVPILILVGMAYPATKSLFRIDDVTGADMTVKITGYQWMWRYEILNYRGAATKVNFVSRISAADDRIRQLGSGESPTLESNPNYLLDADKALTLPTDTKIRFVITADDVIHAWWVPALGWKQDAIPGIINEAWTKILEPGTYRGQCAELCGKDHGFMPIVVNAVKPAEFEAWLAAEQDRKAAAGSTAPSAETPAAPEPPAPDQPAPDQPGQG